LFYQRAGGPLVKGEGGNQDAVCFQYNCAMEQKLAPSGAFAGPTVECEQGITKKVTCSSVASLPAGVPSA
jgi:hypothetical protein